MAEEDLKKINAEIRMLEMRRSSYLWTGAGVALITYVTMPLLAIIFGMVYLFHMALVYGLVTPVLIMGITGVVTGRMIGKALVNLNDEYIMMTAVPPPVKKPEVMEGEVMDFYEDSPSMRTIVGAARTQTPGPRVEKPHMPPEYKVSSGGAYDPSPAVY